MAIKIFPERVRCGKCRKSFGTIVVDGVYCSYACASVSPPKKNINDAPRECKRQVGEKWDFKKRYRSESEVPQKLRDDPGTNIYRCGHCRHLHVGHSRPDSFTRDKLNRVVGDTDTFGSVLARMREDKGWSIARLAAYLKVPQVRIREIENGDEKARMDIAFAAMRAVGLRVVVQER